jgi:molybdopterin biosynthesis enzyme
VGFKRGHILTEADITVLLDMGKTTVYVWEPGADEVHEEDAALELSDVLFGQGIKASGVSEGKIQLTATQNGMFRVNSAALRRLNEVPDYTVACRRKNIFVRAGEALAGFRIVPLVTKRENVDKAVQIAGENAPVFEVLPFKPLKTGVVITGSEVYHGRIPDRFEPLIRAKVGAYGAEVLGVEKADDDSGMIRAKLDRFVSDGAELILLTGGMSVDPDDLTPGAIRQSGADIVCQGVPIQPGNMFMLGYLGNTALIGVPAASLKAPVTSLDIFLPYIFAGVRLTASDTAARGENGFCLLCEQCHYPACYYGVL